MEENQSNGKEPNKRKKIVKRKPEHLEEIEKLLSGPNAFLTDKTSDDALEKLSLKLKLIGTPGFNIEDLMSTSMEDYNPKFKMYWFYKLADLAGVEQKEMSKWVKPEFVRRFIICFVYARFPRMVLRMLRGKNRKSKIKGKLFQYLNKDTSDKLDIIIDQVYTTMNESNNLDDFKMRYSKKYHVYFQLSLF